MAIPLHLLGDSVATYGLQFLIAPKQPPHYLDVITWQGRSTNGIIQIDDLALRVAAHSAAKPTIHGSANGFNGSSPEHGYKHTRQERRKPSAVLCTRG